MKTKIKVFVIIPALILLIGLSLYKGYSYRQQTFLSQLNLIFNMGTTYGIKKVVAVFDSYFPPTTNSPTRR